MNNLSDLSASVIIIARNRPEMVRDCLDHLQQQTFVGAEIIVVGSGRMNHEHSHIWVGGTVWESNPPET